MTIPVALITGSGRKRVGWHVARHLGRAGHRIVLHYNSSQTEAMQSVRELEGEGIVAVALQADLSEPDDVDRLFAGVAEQFGRIDVLVNCASRWISGKLEETTAQHVKESFDVNVLSTFLCAQRAGLTMVEQPEGGCIVNVGDWAIARPYLNHAAYFTAKGCIPTLTRCLAVELASRNPNVRVNCVHPGPVMLPKELSPEARDKAINATLLQREGSPDNVAQAVLALVKNDFITGTCLCVDGGRTIFAGID